MESQIIALALGVSCLALSLWIWQLRNANTILKAEVNSLNRQLEEAIQRLSRHENEPKSKTFAKMIDLLAAAGVPGLVLLAAMAISGFSGGAAITVALASLGGPAGMIGGIGFLITLGIVIAKYGVTDLCTALVRKVLQTGSKAKLIQEINSLPRAVPAKFRLKAKSLVESA
jgi:hypothetical protein